MNVIYCKFCGSPAVVKYGTFEGIQRYYCKSCNRKFADNDALPKMKTPMKVVASALSCYFGGMPLDAIQRHLQQQYGVYFSEMGIYNWVERFAKEAVVKAGKFKPRLGDTWVADETMLKVGGHNVWYWDIIDYDSRYLIASHLSLSRTTRDCALFMKKAKDIAGKSPKKIITDKLFAYIDGIELVFGADTKHIRSKPFVDTDSTNVIERFHGTLKERTDVVRGFRDMATAQLITDAWLVHYNFFKEHESLGNIPPAQKMGIATPFKDWEDVLKLAKDDLVKGMQTTYVPPKRLLSFKKMQAIKKKKRKSRKSKQNKVEPVIPMVIMPKSKITDNRGRQEVFI